MKPYFVHTEESFTGKLDEILEEFKLRLAPLSTSHKFNMRVTTNYGEISSIELIAYADSLCVGNTQEGDES